METSKINFNVDDIYTALSSLGYKKSQIDKSIKKLNESNSFEGNIEDVIKKILSTIRWLISIKLHYTITMKRWVQN